MLEDPLVSSNIVGALHTSVVEPDVTGAIDHGIWSQSLADTKDGSSVHIDDQTQELTSIRNYESKHL